MTHAMPRRSAAWWRRVRRSLCCRRRSCAPCAPRSKPCSTRKPPRASSSSAYWRTGAHSAPSSTAGSRSPMRAPRCRSMRRGPRPDVWPLPARQVLAQVRPSCPARRVATEDDMKAHRPTIMGTRHMVTACQYLAAEAGFRILEAGGNAIDAGVAAGIALGVVQPEYVNFAGVAPIIIYSAKEDRLVTIAGLGGWPKAVTPDYFQKRHGGKIPTGILRTVVPAAPDAWITALKLFGTMSFGEVAQSAI